MSVSWRLEPGSLIVRVYRLDRSTFVFCRVVRAIAFDPLMISVFVLIEQEAIISRQYPHQLDRMPPAVLDTRFA